jgi:hypothetical protein
MKRKIIDKEELKRWSRRWRRCRVFRRNRQLRRLDRGVDWGWGWVECCMICPCLDSIGWIAFGYGLMYRVYGLMYRVLRNETPTADSLFRTRGSYVPALCTHTHFKYVNSVFVSCLPVCLPVCLPACLSASLAALVLCDTPLPHVSTGWLLNMLHYHDDN